MKAMILSAGRGERMRPLTDHTPKPLLQVEGQSLIESTINTLVSAGITEIIINIAYLGQQIKQALGSGQQLGAHIDYSDEGSQSLETGGGIYKALPLLGDQPFLVVNGDIATDYDFSQLPKQPSGLAHLILVPNPAHHPQGDFALTGSLVVESENEPRFTFSGIGIYRPELFNGYQGGRFPLAPLLKEAIYNKNVTGFLFHGFWIDIGTPERLHLLRQRLKNHTIPASTSKRTQYE